MNAVWEKTPLFTHVKEQFENYENGYPRWNLSDSMGRVLAFVELNHAGFFNLFITNGKVNEPLPMFKTAEDAMKYATLQSVLHPEWFAPVTSFNDVEERHGPLS